MNEDVKKEKFAIGGKPDALISVAGKRSRYTGRAVMAGDECKTCSPNGGRAERKLQQKRRVSGSAGRAGLLATLSLELPSTIPSEEEEHDENLREEEEHDENLRGRLGSICSVTSSQCELLLPPDVRDHLKQQLDAHRQVHTHTHDWKTNALVFARAWVSLYAVVMVWAGLWGLLDQYSAWKPSPTRHVLYISVGLVGMIATRTLAFNAGIEMDDWIEVYRPVYKKDKLPTLQWYPPSCRTYVTCLLALAAFVFAALGTLLYWVGCSHLMSSIPYNRPMVHQASWITAALQVLALTVLTLTRALWGASNSRGVGSFQKDDEFDDLLLPKASSSHMARLLRKMKRDWVAWDEMVLEATQRDNYTLFKLYSIMYARAVVALPAVVLIWQTTQVLLTSWKVHSLHEGLVREFTYMLLGTALITLFRPAVFYEEAGLNESNAEEHIIALPPNNPPKSLSRSQRVRVRLAVIWHHIVYELYCVLALYGVMILWQGMEDLLLIADEKRFFTGRTVPGAKDPHFHHLVQETIIGSILLIFTDSFFGAFGLPPASVMRDHLDPRVEPSRFFLSGPAGHRPRHHLEVHALKTEKSERTPRSVATLSQSSQNASEGACMAVV
eukprot:g76023.t1